MLCSACLLDSAASRREVRKGGHHRSGLDDKCCLYMSAVPQKVHQTIMIVHCVPHVARRPDHMPAVSMPGLFVAEYCGCTTLRCSLELYAALHIAVCRGSTLLRCGTWYLCPAACWCKLARMQTTTHVVRLLKDGDTPTAVHQQQTFTAWALAAHASLCTTLGS